MLEKKITAKAGKALKTGSVEEDQAKELKALEDLFPEHPVEKQAEEKVEEKAEEKADETKEETDDDETSEAASE